MKLRICSYFFALIPGLMGFGIEVSGAAGPIQDTKDSLPPGALGQLGSLRFRGRSKIHCVAFSPDGKFVASGGFGNDTDSPIYLWDRASGKLVRRFGDEFLLTYDLAFTPDGSTLVSGGSDGIRYWDVHNGTMLRWTRTTGIVSTLAISADGKIIAAGTEDAIHLWKQNGLELIGSIRCPSRVEFLQFSPDGRLLVSTGWDLKSKDTVRFWDVATRKKAWEIPGQDLEVSWKNSVAFSADGELFAMATEQGEIQIWNTGQRKKVRVLAGSANGKPSRILGFARKDSLLFSLGQEGDIRIWDLVDGKLQEKINERFGRVVALSPDAGTIAYGDARTVKIWDIKAKKHRFKDPGHHLTIESIDFAPDGKTLASCADDQTVRLWDVTARKEFRTWSSKSVRSVRFSPDGRIVLTTNWQYIELRDPFTGKLKAAIGDKNSMILNDAWILPDQETLVSVGEKGVRTWSIAKNRELRLVPCPVQWVNDSAISADGRLVAFTGEKTIGVLDKATGKIHAELNGDRPEKVAFSPGGNHLVWTERNAVVVWDLKRMEMLHRLKTRHPLRALALDRTGRYLAAAGDRPRIRIWDLQDGKPVGDFFQAGSGTYCLAFSPTEDILASAGDDGMVTLWDSNKKIVPPPLPSTDELLRKLLGKYRLFGMPLPPPQARLVCFKEEVDVLGLLVQPAQGKAKRAVFWDSNEATAFWNIDRYMGKYRVIEPAPAVLRNAQLWDRNLLVAIHCKALGWDGLAKALFEASNDIVPETAEVDLANDAWYYWNEKLENPNENWPEIARRLRIIIDAEPENFSAYGKEFVRSLELALIPSKARIGTLKFLVDDLVEAHSTHLTDPRFRKLALRGFDAVPILIDHLDDERLTKVFRRRFINNFGGYHYRIGNVMTKLLQELAGNDLGAWQLRGDPLGKASAQAWWNEAEKIGEEAYLVRHVLGDKETVFPKELMLEIIARKYPKQLPQIYRTRLTERPKMKGWSILHAISASSLSIEQKRELFRLGAKHKDPDHRKEALRLLQKLDPR